jgi:hypothetical protein
MSKPAVSLAQRKIWQLISARGDLLIETCAVTRFRTSPSILIIVGGSILVNAFPIARPIQFADLRISRTRATERRSLLVRQERDLQGLAGAI